MKRYDVVNLKNSLVNARDWLDSHEDVKVSKSFKFSMIRTVKKLKEQVEEYQETIDTPDEIDEYNRERKELIFLCARKDENGNPIQFKNGSVDIASESVDTFRSGIQELQNKYSDALEKQKKDLDEYKEFLEEDESEEIIDALLFNMKSLDVEKDTPEELPMVFQEVLLSIEEYWQGKESGKEEGE